MAMIDKIRRQRELLVILIGLGMLMFLIPYDAVMGLVGVGPNRSVGEVNGEPISLANYQTQLEDRREYFNSTTPEDIAWNDLVEQAIFAPNYDELGIEVTNDEFQEILYGEHVSDYVKSAFYQTFGGLSPESRPLMQNWFSSMYDGNEQAQRQFFAYHRAILDARKKEKWQNLLEKSPFATTLEAQWDYSFNNDKVPVQVVYQAFDNIPDSLYTASDVEIKDYYKKHKNEARFEQKVDEREIEYIEVNVRPSDADSAAYINDLTDIRPGWESAENDSAYCVEHTSNKRYFETTYTPGSVAVDTITDKLLSNSEIGTIVGPYKESNYYRLVKIIDRKILPDSVQARHMLFSENNAITPRQQILADSVYAVLQEDPGQFESLMNEFTKDTVSLQDPVQWVGGTVRKAGSYTNAINWASTGEIVKVNFGNGIWLIEVMDQNVSGEDYTIKIATIDRAILPSPDTNNEAYKELNQQFLGVKSQEKFAELADEYEYVVKTASVGRSGQIAGISGSERAVAWANGETEVGKVSYPIKTQKGHVIACLTLIKNKGAKPLEAVRDEIEQEVIDEKKGEDYYQKMRVGNTLEEIAEIIDGKVMTANVSLSANYLPNVSSPGTTKHDYEVVGLCFGMTTDELTVVKAASGVYAISPSAEITKAAEKEFLVEEQDALITSYRTQVVTPIAVNNAMKDKADVEDNRYKQ